MTKRNSADVAFFLLGGYDILGTLTEVDLHGEAILERTDALGDSWQAQAFVGGKDMSLTQKGFYDDNAGSVHDALSTGPGVSRVLCLGVEGTATGAGFYGLQGAMQVDYKRLSKRNEFTKSEAEYKGNGILNYGQIVRTYKAAGATGASTGTPLDNAASSTGVAAYLAYNSSAGEANIRVLDSPDNVTYSAAFTFTKTTKGTAAVVAGAERLYTSGAIQRYTAVDITTASATGSIGALNLFVGIARGATA